MGVCGGYQMLGRTIADPSGTEGEPGSVAGLGLLDVETVLSHEKILKKQAALLKAHIQLSPVMKCIWGGRLAWAESGLYCA